MVIKHVDPKNGTCFFYADQFLVKRIIIDKENPIKDKDEISENFFFDKGRNRLEYNQYVKQIQDKTGWDNLAVDFVFNGNYDDLETVIVAYPRFNYKTENHSMNSILVFNDFTWLMTDNGDTIERLI